MSYRLTIPLLLDVNIITVLMRCHGAGGEMVTRMMFLTAYTRWRYLVLLGTLLLVLVVQPISFGFSGPPLLFDAFLMLVTIALLLSFSPDKKKRLFAFGIGLPTGVLSLGGHVFSARPDNAVVLIGHCLAVAFYFWAAVVIVVSLVRSKALSLDSIFGTICGYLLLGMAWGVLYSMLDTIWPGSFEVGDRLVQQTQADHSRIHLFTYYSFITLTTVGYGDVTPLSTPARTCAWLEALTGQFYLAVLVAGLVGALLSKKT
jgi:voltage-gated potassium channel